MPITVCRGWKTRHWIVWNAENARTSTTVYCIVKEHLKY